MEIYEKFLSTALMVNKSSYGGPFAIIDGRKRRKGMVICLPRCKAEAHRNKWFGNPQNNPIQAASGSLHFPRLLEWKLAISVQ